MSFEAGDSDPFAEGAAEAAEKGAGDAAEGAAEGTNSAEWFGLRNTQPPVGPGEIGKQLDWGAEWWQHLAAGMVKQAPGSDGIEAWQHYVIALMIFWYEAKEGEVEFPGRDRDQESEDEPEDDLGEHPPGTVKGPLPAEE